MTKERFDYKKAGVDIDAGEKAVEDIKALVRSTHRREVLTEIGGFSGLFRPEFGSYKDPVLSAATDGVGTKLKIAFKNGKHDTVGIDAVAMCVNDLLVQGAETLFFLDYLAMGRLDNNLLKEIVSGIAEGCRQAGCALLGGETAEMPDFYAPGEYDLAGFAVGMLDKNRIIDGKKINQGDILIGLGSSGLHSNGYSLVRKVMLEYARLDLAEYFPRLGCTLGEELLKPTLIYVPLVLSLLKEYEIKGMVHVTGGGLEKNLPRVLPAGIKAVIKSDSWYRPPIFSFVQELGNIEEREMFRTFNMGIGMVLVVSESTAGTILSSINKEGWMGALVGHTEEKKGSDPGVQFV